MNSEHFSSWAGQEALGTRPTEGTFQQMALNLGTQALCCHMNLAILNQAHPVLAPVLQRPASMDRQYQLEM